MKIVLSYMEVQPLVAAWEQGKQEVATSPDLGRTVVRVSLSAQGARFPSGVLLRWEEARHILAHPHVCFRVDAHGLTRLQRFSPLTGRVVSLYPTGSAPTLTLSGIPMHRIQGTDPWRDTLTKVRAARPRGRVLDTCMGLGYTAIAAARRADWVLTVELDPVVIWLARENPWSEDLFRAPNIAVVQGAAEVFLPTLPDAFFSTIIHDPPMFSLAGELYSLSFYRELYRVLRPRGRLFHYVGNPEGKMARNVMRSVARRLQEAGFRRVRPAHEAFGLIATK